jgi:hypothetical protein
MLECIYDEKTEREKENAMMNCNWIIRDLMAKKRAMKDAGIDIAPLDNEKKVNEAFKNSGLKMSNMNNRGIA